MFLVYIIYVNICKRLLVEEYWILIFLISFLFLFYFMENDIIFSFFVELKVNNILDINNRSEKFKYRFIIVNL